MRSIFVVVLLASAVAHAAWGSPKGKKLAAGDLGVVRLIKNDKKLVLDIYFPREWMERDVKLGTKITTKELLVLADTEGVFYEGPAPIFVTKAECENDGGTYSEPVGRLELDPSQLKRVPSTKPFGSEKNLGLATLGKTKRKPIENAATSRTLARADFDGDGVPDAELRSSKTDAGCGDTLEEDGLQIINATSAFSARCCGP
jgi:hypothetical protein